MTWLRVAAMREVSYGYTDLQTDEPRRRNASVIDYKRELTATKPEKSLCKRIKKSGGRNHHGETTVRFRGGGARRIYRIIDFKRNKDGIPAKVATIEYDPNRNCFISLLHYVDGEKRYILSPAGIKVGEMVESGENVEPKTGNAMPLGSIPVGVEIHNIEMMAGQGGKLVRSAGGTARLMAREGDWVTVVLPSGEMRMLRSECRATIGTLSNSDYQNVKIGKASASGIWQTASRSRQRQNPCRIRWAAAKAGSTADRIRALPNGVLAVGRQTRNPRKVSNSALFAARTTAAGNWFCSMVRLKRGRD